MRYNTYSPKGETNKINLICALSFAIIISVFLGWIYTINSYIPFIIIRGSLAIGFGFVLAYIIQIITNLFNIIEKRTRIIIVSISVLVVFYSSWISFILFIYYGEFPPFFDYIYYWSHPTNFYNSIAEINLNGTWELKGAIVKKTVLLIVWIIEFLIITTIPILKILRFPENPYSEKLNKWYPKLTLQENFEPVYSKNVFKKNLNENGINAILNMATEFSTKYSTISIFYLEQEDIQYLSIDNIFIDVKNKSKETKKPIIKPIEINNTEVKKLINKFQTKKEFYLKF